MSNVSQITDYTLPPAGRAVVVSHGVNKGKGRAVRTSLGYAAEHGFDALVLLDGDGQHDPGGLSDCLNIGALGLFIGLMLNVIYRLRVGGS